MWIREPLLTEKISAEIENSSCDAERLIKCPKCGRILYAEELSDRCPYCMATLTGNIGLIFQEKPYGLIARIMFIVVLAENLIPFALFGSFPTQGEVLYEVYFAAFAAVIKNWTLHINPLYLCYVRIDDNNLRKRELTRSKRRCTVYFILQGIVFLFLSGLLKIDRCMTILSIVLLLIAFIISYINIVFPHITRYESLYSRFLLKIAVDSNIYTSILIWICVGLSVTVIVNIIRLNLL